MSPASSPESTSTDAPRFGPVRTGPARGALVEALAGLGAGDVVLVNPIQED